MSLKLTLFIQGEVNCKNRKSGDTLKNVKEPPVKKTNSCLKELYVQYSQKNFPRTELSEELPNSLPKAKKRDS